MNRTLMLVIGAALAAQANANPAFTLSSPGNVAHRLCHRQRRADHRLFDGRHPALAASS